MKYKFLFYFLISEPFITVGKIYDAAIVETVLLDVVLHDMIILMGINTDVGIMQKAEVHNVGKDAVNIRIAGNTMNDMIGLYVI